MKRALALVLVLAGAVLLGAGCGPAAGPLSLRPKHGGGPFTCELDLRDPPCIVCIKQACCERARACDNRKDKCPCSITCISTGNTPACAAACAGAEDRAMAECAATACQNQCFAAGV